jgi:DNA-directed RNA polymerase subunit RPC12/RpoP
MATKETRICPNCGSGEVSKPKYSARAFAISLLLLGIPLPFVSRTYFCFDCREEFKKTDFKK